MSDTSIDTPPHPAPDTIGAQLGPRPPAPFVAHPGAVASRFAAMAAAHSAARAGLAGPHGSMTMAKVGTGARFGALKKSLGHQKGVTNPGALAAWIGRSKYGPAKFNKFAKAGMKRAGK